MDSALLSIAENCTYVERIVFNDLLGLLRCDVVQCDVLDVCCIPIKFHGENFLPKPAYRECPAAGILMGMSFELSV